MPSNSEQRCRRLRTLFTSRFARACLGEPYLHFDPSFCFVIERDKKLLGYIVVAQDTQQFKRWQHENWWPLVEERLIGFEPKTEFDQLGLNAIENEKQSAPGFAKHFPAHLHINLLPEAQGTGFGRKLVDIACEKLAAARVTGVHLGGVQAKHKGNRLLQRAWLPRNRR